MKGVVTGRLMGLRSYPPSVDLKMSDESSCTIRIESPIEDINWAAPLFGQLVTATALPNGRWTFTAAMPEPERKIQYLPPERGLQKRKDYPAIWCWVFHPWLVKPFDGATYRCERCDRIVPTFLFEDFVVEALARRIALRRRSRFDHSTELQQLYLLQDEAQRKQFEVALARRQSSR